MSYRVTRARWAATATTYGVPAALVYDPAPCPHGHRPDPDWVPDRPCPHCLTDIGRRLDCAPPAALAWMEASGHPETWWVGRTPKDLATPGVALAVAAFWQAGSLVPRSYTLHVPPLSHAAHVRIRQGRWMRVVPAPDGNLSRALAMALWWAWQAWPATRPGTPGIQESWWGRVARWLSRPVF